MNPTAASPPEKQGPKEMLASFEQAEEKKRLIFLSKRVYDIIRQKKTVNGTTVPRLDNKLFPR